jgi:predicted branched-subunit amino acid permease
VARLPRGALVGLDRARRRVGARRAAPPALRFLTGDRRDRRKAVTVAVAVSLFGLSFGVLASENGLSVAKAAALSLFVFAGGSQLAAVGLAGAGNPAAGVVTGLLLNSRLAAFGVLAAPYVAGPWWKRALGSQLVVDEPVVLALEHDDRDRARATFWFSGILLYVCWNVVTIVGAAVGDVLGDPDRIGLDGAFPAVFVALLAPRLRVRASRRVAIGGAAIALALTPLLPPGIPVLLAAVAIVLGVRS